MADVLELKGENPFRIRAYRRATQNLESLSEDMQAVAREDRLEDVPGIGADLACAAAGLGSAGEAGCQWHSLKGAEPFV